MDRPGIVPHPDLGTCAHVPAAPPVASGEQCEACGSTRNIRLCATCGHVGCCDSQAGHARTHASETGHPVIYQTPHGSGFVWCYVHDRYVD